MPHPYPARKRHTGEFTQMPDAAVICACLQHLNLQLLRRFSAALTAICFTFAVGASLAKEQGVFAAPALTGYSYDRTIYVDASCPVDGLKETAIDRYIDKTNRRVYRYRVGDKTWALGAKDPANTADTTHNYTIVDSDGDGVFDERYRLYEEFCLPDWVKKAEKK